MSKQGRRMIAKKTLSPELEDELKKLLDEGASRDLQAGTRPYNGGPHPATKSRTYNGTEAYLNAKIATLKDA
ncbi:hypothetical protein QFC20_007187 [Naganishia adeliensis]|uniref:Uncharacterized protein n=1 Tax=Naganishia adeliensis TaxID=92952 RepID=A0ACC2V1K1_9TREE|nr:hypothetical protein QFC20_007187 [Naganishia adeliensis]